MGFGMTNGTGKTGWYAKKAYETSAAAKETADTALDKAEEAMKLIQADVIETLPTQSATLTYDGTEQEVTFTGYKNGSLTFGGVLKATNAGSYTATATPTEGYKWEDQTREPRNVVWSIGRQPVAVVPTQDMANPPVYDGTAKSPEWQNYDTEKLAIGGAYEETNAGTYTAHFTPKANYQWADGSVDYKSAQWTFGKAPLTVPAQTGTLTYDGTEKNPTLDESYDEDLMSLSSDTEATAAGSYALTVTLTDSSNYQWNDGTIENKTVPWTIYRSAISVVPSQDLTVTHTYTGSAQSPTWKNYNSEQLTIGGTTVGTGAGTYTATFTPKANYTWADEDGTDAKTVTWTIAPKTVAIPTMTDKSKTYNTASQAPTISTIDTGEVTQSGDASATNAGTYTVYWDLTSTTNYVWSDGSTAQKSDTWTIAKAAGTITLPKNSVSLDTTTLSDTVTITYAGDGTLSVSSSDTSIATATRSGSTVTITAVATGSATVTVKATAGANYEAGTATVSVTCALAPVIKSTLNDNTWDAISYVAKEGTGDTYWDIGDVKMVTLNGKIGDNFTASNLSIGVFILDFNHKDNNVAESNIIFGGFKSALSGGKDVALIDIDGYPYKEDGTKMFNFNHWGNLNYGGWKGSDIRYDVLGATSTQPSDYGKAHTTSCVGYDATAATLTSPKADTFLAALPSDLRSKIRLRTHYVDNIGNRSNEDANVTAVTDAVFLLAEFEIFGSRTYANEYEKNHQAQMKYYANGNSRIKYKHNSTSTAVYWWECSLYYGSATAFCGVYTDGGAAFYAAYRALGLAPAFKI